MRGRLWRAANPHLDPGEREELVKELMDARRAVGAALRAADVTAEKAARARVHAAKVALGERGPVWWTDGAPDYNRHLVKNTPYADHSRDGLTVAARRSGARE
ncbi:hypothetical protein [Qipengyuania sediminis]|uniref:hypothetical protein n=1 Tax=Qipengyuania sediminis TaxID=1532023 RepID=UPI001F10A917|nr:hypothetical protein [Qipengyuania sediminis]